MFAGSKLRTGKITRSLEAISFPSLKPGPMTPVPSAPTAKKSPEPRLVHVGALVDCPFLPQFETGRGVAEVECGALFGLPVVPQEFSKFCQVTRSTCKMHA